MHTQILNKISDLDVDTLQIMATMLMTDTREGADLAFEATMEMLMLKMPSHEYIAFSDSL